MKSNNGSPKNPHDFLAELQHNALNQVTQESSLQLDHFQPATPPPETETYQDQIEAIQAAAIAAIARLSSQAHLELFHMLFEQRDLQFQCKTLTQQNKQMSLKIEELNETITARDASIEGLNARIEQLASERTKIQTA